jgi:hypothetical protein
MTLTPTISSHSSHPHTMPMRRSLSFNASVRTPVAKASPATTYTSNGYTMNLSTGFLANPSRSAQIQANNAGALTRSEASSFGLSMGGRR